MNKLIIVFHETMVNIPRIDKIHQSYAPGVSYHFVIQRNGTLISYVPPSKRAYAAGKAIFVNSQGEEEHINNSVDDFSLHVALETPFEAILDQQDSGKRLKYHTGYTVPQYKSAAWVIAQTGMRDLTRVTTHDRIRLDQSEDSIGDPRCFNLDFLISLVSKYNLDGSTNFDFGLLEVN